MAGQGMVGAGAVVPEGEGSKGPWWLRFVRWAVPRLWGFVKAVIVSVVVLMCVQWLTYWWHGIEIVIDTPDPRARHQVPLDPCVLVAGHGRPKSADVVPVVYVYRIVDGNPVGDMSFYTQLDYDDDRWRVKVLLAGPAYSWFRIRVVPVDAEQVDYYTDLERRGGQPAWTAREEPPHVRPTSDESTVEVQVGPGGHSARC
ncbi:hypothetical protein [Microbispora sp. H10670]|uniref:hypothetical protein n=1 Tax=Microbispora sp. H10670 TaxID=2729108 RepID=UPI0015FF3937|nr:hypothetical protein [Microbispora sp. H10670]